MEIEKVGVILPQWEMLPDIGLYMDQVITLMERTFSPALPKGEITKSMVNNYVKVGLVPRPAGKKYDREHLAVLLMICVFKQALSMENIAQILKSLCADGVQKGYNHFRETAELLEASALEGCLGIGKESVEEQALRSGLMAALSTVRTSRLLEELRNRTHEKGV